MIKPKDTENKFRLPRKVKKKLKKGFWLYLPDEGGSSLQANPTKSQEDYTALKQGRVRNLMDKKNSHKRRLEFSKKINGEVSVSDETLKKYVDDIIREDLRSASYNILIEAKNNPKGIKAYYNFINAYHLQEQGERSFGNICCLAIDEAKELLKKKR